MRIYSMTATFGKLEHETLQLQPGLNILEAPNEWGKSTWCAFLVNMLYGLDTRARTTKQELADKERYAPWSGAPMSGRIDLSWNGRDITVERRSRGRVPFGEFSAYETATGLEVPELNGINCGSMLLGVERSVFVRAGFVKLTDLPVTQDEALRRRLNNLVTTGDESGAGDKLQQALKDLKNKCRFNRSGLLPQAEAQRDQLTGQLQELTQLHTLSEHLTARQAELESRIADLENHRTALSYAAAQEDRQKVAAAEDAQAAASSKAAAAENDCRGLPSLEQARQTLHRAEELHRQLLSIQLEGQMLPPLPPQPPVPGCYRNTPDPVAAAREDAAAYAAQEAGRKRRNRAVGLCTALLVLFAAALLAAKLLFSLENPLLYLLGGAATVLGAVCLIAVPIAATARYRDRVQLLFDRHPGIPPKDWESHAQAYASQQAAYAQAAAQATALRGDFAQRQQALQQQLDAFTQGQPLEQLLSHSRAAIAAWQAHDDAQRQLHLAQTHLQALRSMAHTAEKPRQPDSLTHTEAETVALLQSARFELRQNQNKLGQYQGRSEALGQEAVLRSRLKAVNQRIARLEDTYAALEIAQKALSTASAQLQRRFAPRIAKRAQALFSRLTGGKYDRLTLSEDLSVNAGAAAEDTLRSAQWRSDGTVDQLYLALRLAVAEELTTDAPLVLDDALSRFDDTRLRAAMALLQETAQQKQILLFTCQSRESACL